MIHVVQRVLHLKCTWKWSIRFKTEYMSCGNYEKSTYICISEICLMLTCSMLIGSRKCTFLNCILALFWREIQFCFRNQVGRLLEPSTPPTCNSYGSYRLSLFQAYCSWFCLRSKSVVDPFILWISFAGLSLLNTVNKYQHIKYLNPTSGNICPYDPHLYMTLFTLEYFLLAVQISILYSCVCTTALSFAYCHGKTRPGSSLRKVLAGSMQWIGKWVDPWNKRELMCVLLNGTWRATDHTYTETGRLASVAFIYLTVI